MSRASLLIPVQGSDENVEVFVDELPENAEDILAILQAEIAPLDIWLKFAVEYYRQGKIESFLKILNEGTDPGLEEYYPDSKAERIALLNAMASYYTQLASRERDKTKKDDHFSKATGSFNKADKIDHLNFLTWVGKGVLYLYKGDLDRAVYSFDTVLQDMEDNIPALMGKACVQFNKGQYQEALATYKSILQKNPACPPAIRLGLGFCFYKLGRTDLARQAFERVLQLEPNNVEALVGLAIFELNTEKQGSITSAMHMLKKAFEANSSNSMVLNHLANHFFYKKDYQKVDTLALQAYHNTEVAQIKAFSCYMLAKSYHARGSESDCDKAYNYYAQALRHWPQFDLAQFGVAQMLLYKGKTEEAINYFDAVLTSHPDNFETLKILGSLYAVSKNSKDKAKQYLKKATDLNASDYEAWLELAQLTELTDMPGALAAYEKAKQLLQKRREKVPAELWNNLAVLRHKLGNYKGAEEAYKGALIASGNVSTDNSNEFTKEVKPQTVTMLYNLARLYEDMHQPEEARELYISILTSHPNYVDCYMRLGCIDRDRKQYYNASTWFKECLVIASENPDTWALIGNMHLGKEEWQQAQKKFEKVIEKDRTDPYSLLSLGNIYYNAKFNTADKEAKYIRLANDFYWKVLQKNPANIYAANGVGIVFAEKGEIGLAKEFFTQVSEAADNMADVRLNLAHVHFAQGLFINAVKLYQNCLKKFYENKDPEVLLCLARAYFEWNKLEDCKQTLQKAIHIDPTNLVLWYNLAITQHKNADTILHKPQRIRTLQDLQIALTDLKQAIATFTNLSQPKSTVKPAYRVDKAQRNVKLCTKLLHDAQQIYVEAEKEEQVLAQRKAEMQQLQEEVERVAREKREKEEAEAEERKAEHERAMQELLEEQNRILEKYVRPEPVPEEEGGERKKKRKSKNNKKKKKDADETEETQEVPQEPEEGEGVPPTEEESWETVRDKRNPMAKELLRKQKERESAKKEKKRRRTVADDDGEQEKRKSKKKSSKRSVEDEDEEMQEDDQKVEDEGVAVEGVEPTEQSEEQEDNQLEEEREEMGETQADPSDADMQATQIDPVSST